MRGSASGNLNCESICDKCERDVGRQGNVRRNEVRKYGSVKAVKECEGKREWTCKGKVCYTPHSHARTQTVVHLTICSHM